MSTKLNTITIMRGDPLALPFQAMVDGVAQDMTLWDVSGAVGSQAPGRTTYSLVATLNTVWVDRATGQFEMQGDTIDWPSIVFFDMKYTTDAGQVTHTNKLRILIEEVITP